MAFLRACRQCHALMQGSRLLGELAGPSRAHRCAASLVPPFAGVGPDAGCRQPQLARQPLWWGGAGSDRQPVWAAGGRARREFHSSGEAGYKSGPRRPSWKFVNVQTTPAARQVPRPPEGTSLPRFYVPTEVIRGAQKGSVFQLSETETKHALRALRMAEGDWLEVCDGRGLVVEAQMRGMTYSNKAFATATADPAQVPWDGPRWEVVVALGGLQGSRADTLVEKISEVGAWSLRPLLTHRSRTIGKFEEKDTVRIVEVEELSDGSELEEEDDFMRTGRFARWERVAIAAGKQSLRASSLLMRPPCVLEQLLPQIEAGAPAFVAKQGAPPLHRVLDESADALRAAADGGGGGAAAGEPGAAPRACLLLVGPEGDFTESEVKRLEAAGARPVGLGRNRLRVETAAIAMLAGAVLHHDGLRHRAAEEQRLAA